MQYLEVELLHWDTLMALLCHIKREYPGTCCAALVGFICEAWPKAENPLALIVARLRAEHWLVEKESMRRRFRPEWRWALPDLGDALLWRPQPRRGFVWGQPTVWFDRRHRVAWLMPLGLAGWPAFSIDQSGGTLRIERVERALVATPAAMNDAIQALL